MGYQKLVKDFAWRTQQNLEVFRTFQQEHPDTSVYEVTQLINSMLGLLVLPQQRYITQIPSIPLANLANQGWPIPVTDSTYPSVQTLDKLVRYLRNAIAHAHISFLTDEANEIIGVRLWNIYDKQKNWEVELQLEDLREFTERFVSLILQEIDVTDSLEE